mgnify:CR=1 FL=1
MIRLFAFVRRVLALESASRALGEVAHDAIRKYMIPQVRRALKSAKTDSETQRLTEPHPPRVADLVVAWF